MNLAHASERGVIGLTAGAALAPRPTVDGGYAAR